MTDKQSYRRLDFGSGAQKLETPVIKLMNQRKIQELRTFNTDDSLKPIGLIGLGKINKHFKTAILWYLLRDKNY